MQKKTAQEAQKQLVERDHALRLQTKQNEQLEKQLRDQKARAADEEAKKQKILEKLELERKHLEQEVQQRRRELLEKDAAIEAAKTASSKKGTYIRRP